MQGVEAITELFVKFLWWTVYLFVWGPWVAWPRAVWRRLYPALKLKNMHRTIWLPALLVAAWYAFDTYLQKTPTASVDFFGIERGLRRLWAEINAAVAFLFGVFFAIVKDKALQSPGWGWLLPALFATQTFLVSSIMMAPLHVLGLFLFPGAAQKTASHGSALWGNPEHARSAGSLLPTGYVGGLMLGRLQQSAPKKHDPRLRVWRHVLTCAPTGAGKGVGCVIPNLLEYPGSVVCLDVKGENFAVSARARAEMGQEICCFDPFGITGVATQSLNWLDAIDPGNEECVSDAASLADTLVVRSGRGDAHWDEAAASLLQGLVLHVASLPPAERHMGTVRRLLTRPEAELTAYLQTLAQNPDEGPESAYGVPARAAGAWLGKADRERSGVLSTAQRHTAFLDDPRIVRAVSRTEINLTALKTRSISFYIVLPPDKLAAYARVARAAVGLAVKAMLRQAGRPQHDVLFLLDEFAQLGHFAAVEDSLAILRGYGGVYWLLVQDLSQLRAVYPKAETFLSNTVLQAFGTQDYQTARYLSHMLGSETIRVASQSTSETQSFAQNSSGSSESISSRARELLTPDEIRRMSADRVLVFEQGQPPHLLRRLDHRTDPESRGLADENPMHRRLTRSA